MIKIALTSKIVNALVKKIAAKALAKKLGVDGKVYINELSAVETEGRVKIKINAEIDMTSAAAESFIDTF